MVAITKNKTTISNHIMRLIVVKETLINLNIMMIEVIEVKVEEEDVEEVEEEVVAMEVKKVKKPIPTMIMIIKAKVNIKY